MSAIRPEALRVASLTHPNWSARHLLALPGTIVVIVGLSILPLLTPAFTHAALDLAGAAARLGVGAGEAHALSDRSIGELLTGPGTFAFPAPDGEAFYDAAERSHLRDARSLLWATLIAAAAAASLIGIAVWRSSGAERVALWRAVSRGGATASLGVVVLGMVAALAFEPLFNVFHGLFFPAGNWAFDPTSQRLVQLYPTAFWQAAAAALGALTAAFGAATWWLGRRMADSAFTESV